MVGGMLAAIPFPEFNPVFIDLGFFQIRWYGMAYLAGILLGWWYMVRITAPKYWPDGAPLERKDIEDLLLWVVVGVVAGGRLGYVIFYQPGQYLADPLSIFMVWKGGMALHGGLLGVVLAIFFFARHRGKSFLAMGDMVCCVVPIGLGLGRLANFINGELFGRVTDFAWGMIFPNVQPLGQPRHASQLYEAVLEGLVIFLILRLMFSRPSIRHKPGMIAGAFFILYGAFRFAVEYVREPDEYLGELLFGATMGQLLCIPMLLFGLGLMIYARRNA